MTEFELGERVRVKSSVTRQKLKDIGICSDSTFDYLLNGEIKTVFGQEKALVYLKERDKSILWVYDYMLERVDAPIVSDPTA